MSPIISSWWRQCWILVKISLGSGGKFSHGQLVILWGFSFLISPLVKWSEVSHVRLFATPWTVAYQAPLSMGFSRPRYWSPRLPFPSPEDLPHPGIEPWSPTLQAEALLSEPPGKPVSPLGGTNITTSQSNHEDKTNVSKHLGQCLA